MSQEKAKPKSEIKLPKLCIAIAIGVVVALIPAPAGLEPVAMRYLGVFFGMLSGLLLGAGPMWFVTALSAIALPLFNVVPFKTAFANYSGTTVWMVLAVVGFASCIGSCGLMKRIAFNVLKPFPPSYKGQVLAILTAGVVLTPLIPSTSAKTAVLAPFTGAVASETGIQPHSKAAAGLWYVMFTSSYLLAPMFITGSNICYILLGMIPEDVAAGFNFMTWLSASWVWGVIIIIGTAIIGTVFIKPDQEISMSKDFITGKLAEMGPMSSDEKFCACALAGAMLLWITNSWHGIDSALVAWLVLFAMIIRGLFNTKDTVTKLPWNLVLMFGCMMGVVDQMRPMGITSWLATILGPVMGKLIPNSFVFLVVMMIVLYCLRLFVDSLSTLAILVAVFSPIAEIVGVSPFIIVFAAWVGGQQWILPHNNMMVHQTGAMMGGMIEHKDVNKLAPLYMINSAIGILASIPVWKAIGLM